MWFLGFIAVIVGAYFAVVFVAPIALAVGGVVAGGVAFVEYTTASAFVFRGGAPIDHLRIEPRTEPGRGGKQPEPAYRSYYFGPVFRDYWLAVRTAARRVWDGCFGGLPADPAAGRPLARPALAQRLLDAWRHVDVYIPTNPVAARAITVGPMVGGMAGLVAGAAAAAALLAATSAVFGVLLLLIAVLALLTGGTMRFLEIAVLRVRSITLECGRCHRRATAPVYQCAHCTPGAGPAALHRRLVPGSHGVFHRTCRCGNPLPTLLARGKWKLQAFCQHCAEPFPLHGLTTPTFHVPVIAGRQAGKTVFMMSALAGLEQQLDSGNAAGFDFADPTVLPEYERARDALRTQSLTAIRATLPVAAVPAFNVYLGTGKRRRLLYLYDAAGERMETEAGTASMGYLEHAGGVVVIVDPFSFPDVRRHTERTILDPVRHSIADVEEVLGRFAESLRQSLGGHAGRTLNVRVAVVLTKCDALVESAEVAHPYEDLAAAASDPTQRAERSTAIRGWLASVAGRPGLLAALDTTFAKCEFFAVSARDAFGADAQPSGRTHTVVRNDEPSAPLIWLLDRRDRT